MLLFHVASSNQNDDMNQNKDIAYWLLTGCMLIAIMVVIGGITRLTNSGLSMVEWEPIMGAIPPLNEHDWNDAFEAYKQSPEFNLLNYNFTMNEFKSIFWWEYIHRLLGRILGVVFIVPFMVFLVKKRLSNQWIRKLAIVFFLGAFQGILGWYMVKSGLVKNPHVSHYRLAAHLVTALILFSYCLWLALDFLSPKIRSAINLPLIKKTSFGLLVLVFVQIFYGALVAGLKAGYVYNTFPKMGSKWMPDSVGYAFGNTGAISLLENIATVQLIHRYLAVMVIIVVLFIWWHIRKKSEVNKQRKLVNFLLLIVAFQFSLGVLTLIYQVPIFLGVLHQTGAIFLLITTIWLVHQQK